MSYCRKEGKDQIIFVTKDDYEKQTPGNPLLPDNEETVGLIKENGDINWECPCLQGMADGPCGEPFKDAFSCFHYSEAEPKGVDCLEQFKSMQECFLSYPEVYGSLDDDIKESSDDSTKQIEENQNKVAESVDNTTEQIASEAVEIVNEATELADTLEQLENIEVVDTSDNDDNATKINKLAETLEKTEILSDS